MRKNYNIVLCLASTLLIAHGIVKALPSTLSDPLVTVFTSNGTWTKSTNAQHMVVIVINGGGGGGSGRQDASGTAGGGSGGASGSAVFWKGPASFFGSAETVIVGAGGTGGTAQTSASTDGNDGSAGGQSSFGIITPIPASGGNAGFGGTSSPSFAIPNSGTIFQLSPLGQIPNLNSAYNFGGTAGFGNTTSGTDAQPLAVYYGVPGCGGGGAGADTGTQWQGGQGSGVGDHASGAFILVPGAIGGIESGTIDGTDGNDATYQSGGFAYGGLGGGGGGGQSSGIVAGNGGKGGLGGGGGGGGAGSLNGTDSGAGGDGGDGLVIVIEYYS